MTTYQAQPKIKEINYCYNEKEQIKRKITSKIYIIDYCSYVQRKKNDFVEQLDCIIDHTAFQLKLSTKKYEPCSINFETNFEFTFLNMTQKINNYQIKFQVFANFFSISTKPYYTN